MLLLKNNPIKHSLELPLSGAFLDNHLAKYTRLAYRKDLTRLKEFLSPLNIASVKEVSTIDLIAFRNSMSSMAITSQNRIMSTVRSYFQFLVSQSVLEKNPTNPIKAFPRSSSQKTNELSNEQVRLLFSKIPLTTPTGIQHNAIFHLLFYLGLRRSEVVAILPEDFQQADNVQTLTVRGKGNRSRILPLSETVTAALKLYTDNALPIHGQPFFHAPLTPNLPLSPNTIHKAFKRYSSQSNFPQSVSPHSARATCISNALENGASLIQVQQLGGWQSADMVLRYDRRRQSLKNSAAFAVRY